jgi:SAM-dependent methyltransferase
MGDTTESLLRAVGVGPGMRCLDFGCGAGDVSLFLAWLVGPSGAVVGSDSDGVQLDLVRAECQRLGITTVELVLEGVMELEVSGAYDVVSSRFVLEHLAGVENRRQRSRHPGRGGNGADSAGSPGQRHHHRGELPPTLPVLGAQAVGRSSKPVRARHFTGPHPHRVDRAGRILDRRGLCWHRNRRRRRRTTTSKVGRSS